MNNNNHKKSIDELTNEFFASLPCKTKKIKIINTKEKQDFIKDMDILKDIHTEFDKQREKLRKVGIEDLDIYDVFYKSLGFVSSLICGKYDINEESMDWFVYDNEFGNEKYTCSYLDDDKTYIIDSIESFWNFEKKEI